MSGDHDECVLIVDEQSGELTVSCDEKVVKAVKEADDDEVLDLQKKK